MATCSCPIERSCADTAKTETATPSIHPRESCTSGAHTFCEFSAGRAAGTSKNEARGTVAIGKKIAETTKIGCISGRSRLRFLLVIARMTVR